MHHRESLRRALVVLTLGLLLIPFMTPSAHAQSGLDLDGTDDYVSFGPASELGLGTFTLELWFQRQGPGVAASTGNGGVSAIPLLTKGRGEADGNDRDMNWFLGIRQSDGVLAADFEEGAGGTSPGLNHPVVGSTSIETGRWYHAAATYDGTTWRLYLNGLLEAELAVGEPPRSDSIQYAALGAALTSTGTPAGAFDGLIDEARVWNVARTQAEIQQDLVQQLTTGAGLVGRWGLDEGTGTTAANSITGGSDGTLINGPVWGPSAPFELDGSLGFAGSNAYVDFGDPAALDLATFTLEGWVRRDGPGVAASTGSGGVSAIPLITKGRGEADGNDLDMNWFLGIRESDGVLAADFEEGATGSSPGLNHPVVGATPLTTGIWYHVAATYDGVTWRLYLNGELDAELVVGEPPRSDSRQLAALASALRSTGAPEGYLDGALDEVRVWDYARSIVEIQTEVNSRITTARTGLVARWGLDEGAGSTVFGSAGTTVDGSITGSAWAWGNAAPFDIVVDPETAPTAPTGLAATASSSYTIDLTWTDNADNEQNYEVERSTTGSTGPFEPLATLAQNTTSFAETSLEPGTERCYRVRAVNTFGASGWSLVQCATTPAEGASSLDLAGSDAYTTFGPAPELGLAEFTVEAWVRRDGAGIAAFTGTGGVSAIPLVTKGRGESDGNDRDMNWFLGIRESDGVLAADFEEGAGGTSPGLNHPVVGTTPLTTGVWHHVAMTYDGTTWRLYLDGQPDAELVVGQPPRSDSIQHAALGTALTSTGIQEGYLDGVLDEVRVWNQARSLAEIQATINDEITAPTAGLVARWGLNEGTGTDVFGTAGTPVDGTIVGTAYSWAASAPFDLDVTPTDPPLAPTGLAATAVSPAQIDLSWTDNAGNELGYEIERSTSGAGGPFAPVDTTFANATTYSDVGLTASTEYCYRVRAYNSVGSSSTTTVQCATTPEAGAFGLDFTGTDAYVDFGPTATLGLGQFTLEAWVRRDGAGVASNTGAGGVFAIPLVTKGRGEADGNDRDMNWFLGIRETDGVLAADFEEGAGGASPGLNHPVTGTTPLQTGVWHHVAATYDGTTWRLYLDGVLDAESTVGQPPRSDSIQHAALGSALNSSGTAEGYLDGVLDEVRVWNYARTETEIATSVNQEIEGSATGLVARWGLNEGTGTAVASSAGTAVDGTINGSGYAWIAGAPFDLVVDLPPTAPVLVGPADGATGVSTSPLLDVTVSDPEGQPMTVEFYGRPVQTVTAEPFTIIHLPDTQFYSETYPAVFAAQTQWIAENREALNIVYVDHIGDIVQNGDADPTEWENAWAAMSLLEDPVTTGLPEGIPYSATVGNHDQSPIGDPDGTTNGYNQYFGVDHFSGRSYYGGNYGTSNDNHFSLFSVGDLDFVTLSLEYDLSPEPQVLAWADSVLTAHADRWAIVSNHYTTGTGNPASFSGNGQAVYDALKGNPNWFLTLCGHVIGEGQRVDTFDGSTMYTLLADYQNRPNGGDGWLRIMTFDPSAGEVQVQTYSPTLDQFETDANSQFTLPIDLAGLGGWELLGTVGDVPSDGNAQLSWPGLASETTYEWYVTVSDTSRTVTGPVWSFTTGLGEPQVQVLSPNGGEQLVVGDTADLQWSATDDGTIVGIDVLLSRTGSAGVYDTLAVDLANTGSFSWTVAEPLSEDAWLKVVARDDAGNSGDDISDAAFSITSAVDAPPGSALRTQLVGAAPNPFNPQTTIRFDLAQRERVDLVVYDVSGRRVRTLLGGDTLNAGEHRQVWNGTDDRGAQVSSGIYLVRMTAGDYVARKSVVLVK
ncbi:MAG TPA: LamG-like jellyroll fold domain-containing protein [Candidatus Krumholzibacteria bacterium]|nr:LamG-like jellyroll fold domain-containing protein [Candidatus Krumholzibacteria bacterium]